ncbi:AraC family transcriptional regulator [Actinoplanes sp. TBRC 11911]|uniref:helix-turn-helix transcriptional regulator n=1 Tax=Actinoplanes sp. TBRC 11911 TaxID=2729386 RepID=UPI00145E5E26|nr:AraC family transcriptional regulator [Actinoplanes sp. TBRC 11911]NMO52427.1 AraC family transcriptional regulator [Actinoplanes sp. TBRC 11911]
MTWSADIGTALGWLVPDPIGDRAPIGTLRRTALGSLSAYRLSGSPQVLRFNAPAARRQPKGIVRICIPVDGSGVLDLHGERLPLEPGSMAIHDAADRVDVLLEHPWSCVVLAVDGAALAVPRQVLRNVMSRPIRIDAGPGAVLSGFVSAAIRQGPAMRGAAADRVGEAALHLIAGTVGATELPQYDMAADALRSQVLGYARTHLTDPDLTHARVAAAVHLAPRTLHRLFENEPYTVTEFIRLRRLEGAHRELTDPMFRHRSIAAVAAHWGFPSQAHFTRLFQARYGTSPSALRTSR